MNETELAKLLVRFVGDATSYVKMLKDAEEQTRATAAKVEEAAKKIEGFGKGMENVAGSIAALVGAFGAKEFFGEAKGEWQAAETSLMKLNSVLKANDRDVAGLSERYQTFATNMQKATTYSDEEIQGLLKLAESYDLTGAAAERAVKSATALAKAAEIDERTAMRFSRAMDSGDTDKALMFTRMIPTLRGVKDAQELEVKYQKLIRQGQEEMNAELETGAGRAKNFQNQYSDMMEEVGKYYSQVSNPLKMAKKAAMDLFNGMNDETKKSTVLIGAWTANIALGVGGLALLHEVGKRAWSAMKDLGTSVKGVATAEQTKNMAAYAGAAAGIAAAIVGIGYAVKSATGEIGRIEKMTEDMDRMNSRVMHFQQKGIADRFAAAQAKGPGGRMDALKAELEAAEKKLEIDKASLEMMREHRPNLLERQFDFMSGEITKQEADFQHFKKTVGESEKAVDQLKDSISELEATATNAPGKIVHAFVKASLSVMEILARNKKELEDMSRSLGESADLFGKTDATKTIYKAKKLGASGALLEEITRQAEYLDALKTYEDQKKQLEEIANQAVQDTLTPNEKLAGQIEVLDFALAEGMLTWNQYAKAVQNATEQLRGAEAATRDAAEAGSAEARSRINAYFNSKGMRPNEAQLGGLPAARAPVNQLPPQDQGGFIYPPWLKDWGKQEAIGPKLDAIKDVLQGMDSINLGIANLAGGT